VAVSASIREILEEISDKLARLPGVVAYAWDKSKITTTPAALVGLPDRTRYRTSYSRTGKRLTITAIVLVGKADDRAAQNNLLPFMENSGPMSVFTTLDSEFTDYVTCDDVTVVECEPDVFINAGVHYLGAEFTIDVTATGA
jgi:hypothetical protein